MSDTGVSTPFLIWAAALCAAAQAPDEVAQPLRSDSRAGYVHRLTLYDIDGKVIDPKEQPIRPYSPHATCGKCHAVGSIRRGWHFNADLPDAAPGRPGEPWILTDRRTGTQLPVSARRWPGTFSPAEAGLSGFQFTLAFGRHMPGGGFGDPPKKAADDSPEAVRWGISGNLEIDCLFCHTGETQHDPDEAARQVEYQNFRWRPTAALGVAAIRGEARKIPDDFDPDAPPNPDFPDRALPIIDLNGVRFDADNRVLFNVPRDAPPGRCYFCHTVRPVGPGSPPPWQTAGDVHLAAGMICTSCHRNDVGHMISRGDDRATGLSCEGCHLGVEGAGDPTTAQGGRYGAPHPVHRGFPPIHFEKLTCTACHSGPWPGENVRRVQTSMAHGLGLASKDRRDDDPPAIFEPVFASQPDGTIAPHRMVWPAYWGWLLNGVVRPVPLESARRAAGPQPPVTLEQIGAVLAALAAQTPAEGEPVCIRDGYLYRRTSAGQVEKSAHAAARPYL